MARRAVIPLLAVAALLAAGCGSEEIELDKGESQNVSNGAELFSEHCSGCHSLDAVGAQGSSMNIGDKERTDGPNFNDRREDRGQRALRDPQRRLLRRDHAREHRHRAGRGGRRGLPVQVRGHASAGRNAAAPTTPAAAQPPRAGPPAHPRGSGRREGSARTPRSRRGRCDRRRPRARRRAPLRDHDGRGAARRAEGGVRGGRRGQARGARRLRAARAPPGLSRAGQGSDVAGLGRGRAAAGAPAHAPEPHRPDRRGGGHRRARGRRGGRSGRPSRATTSSWPASGSTWSAARACPARASRTCAASSSCSSWRSCAGRSTSSARHGFQPVIPPVLVREQALFGTGMLPDTEQQIYHVPADDLYLVGTSEVALASLHAEEILDAADLPVRYAGFSPCFRREAGAAGRDTRGLFRVHQFDKVEMFSFVAPEDSAAEHERILAHRGGDPRRARDPVPRREHRGERPGRERGEEVRPRGVAARAGPLPRADVVLEHDRLPGPAARHPDAPGGRPAGDPAHAERHRGRRRAHDHRPAGERPARGRLASRCPRCSCPSELPPSWRPQHDRLRDRPRRRRRGPLRRAPTSPASSAA